MAEVLVGAALVDAARDFACRAHAQVGQLRKYTGQPYAEHLGRVAGIVATVSEDAEMLAAAWLHDVVEDTPVTIEEVGRHFGASVRELVDALTDVSRPQDGNRAQRKALDLEHLARAPARAQTVKLADLIDNCQDVCKHDAGFGRVFLSEMAQLLDVLTAGDHALIQRARKTHEKWLARVGKAPVQTEQQTDRALEALLAQPRSRRTLSVFVRLFSAGDVAEPLRSFDAGTSVTEANGLSGASVLGVRRSGVVQGYVRADQLGEGRFADAMQPIAPTQRLQMDTVLSDVVLALTRHDYVFLAEQGMVVSYIGRPQMQGAEVRMWLFGMITTLEMLVTEGLRAAGDSIEWQPLLSPARLAKAHEMLRLRTHAGRPASLLDCLQLSDKLNIVRTLDATPRALIRGQSRAESQRLARDLENLRNGLAHAQDIVSHDWAQIARLAHRIEELARFT